MIKKLLYRTILSACSLLLFLSNCSTFTEKESETLFEKIPSNTSNIGFSNDLLFNDSLNVFNYINFYSGGGVALGDVNNNGLLDIYLVSNQESNRLYLNKGNMQFEDITEKSGVGGTKEWSTGVSFADVNGDGLLDIYVSNAGGSEKTDRKNELFINEGNLKFTERAEEYGIADEGNSIHAAFFDFDHDGDLDMYLLNNYNSKPIGRYDLQRNRRQEQNFLGGDRFYRNELISNSSDDSETINETPHFTDVTQQTGIFSSEIGFGLGISVGDLNNDGWMDIYISNDFFERDYLYLNNRDSTFREVIEEKFSSISTTSMGGDIADLNNDGFPELFITDMLPEKEERLKTNTDFIGWSRYQSEVDMGYHHKFTRNTLQYNNGNGTFSEIGRYAGVEATDWSWGGLMADFNLDGLRDIFVSNGVYKDQTNKDYLLTTVNREVMKEFVVDNQIDYEKLLEIIPTVALSNYLFENKGDLQFVNQASEWGLDEPGFSNGSAYGDLDNDGDLDLVINNINMDAFVFRNRSSEFFPDRNWIKLILQGESPNTAGIGAKIELITDEQRWYGEQMLQRGYLSSVDPTLHVGLGTDVAIIDTLKVQWPDGRVSLQLNVETNQSLNVRQDEASEYVERSKNNLTSHKPPQKTLLENVTGKLGIDWKHTESVHNDFDQSPMLFHMRSNEGPPICTGDINNDGRDDFYVGGARGQSGALFLQQNDQFIETYQPALEADQDSEDTDCIFFDATGDGNLELYVASGSNEYPTGNQALADRLYQIDETGSLSLVNNALPEPDGGYQPTGVVKAVDLDKNGSLDLFLGVRMDNSVYGNPVGGSVLKNNGKGRFEDITDQVAPGLHPEELRSAGITDAVFGDLNGDDTPDLVIAGEWMPLTVFFNRNGKLERADSKDVGLGNTYGWWKSLELADLDGDGNIDLIGGNHGLNSRFKAKENQPVQMWVGDFENNGSMDHIFAVFNNGEGPYPLALRHDMIQQLRFIQESYPSYSSYAQQTVNDLFTRQQLDNTEHYKAENFASIVGLNNGDGTFQIKNLPFRVQFSPVYGLHVIDLKGKKTLIAGGNLYNANPQAGIYDASYGSLLQFDSTKNKFRDVPSQISGLLSSGEIRDIESLNYKEQTLILISRNDHSLQAYLVD